MSKKVLKASAGTGKTYRLALEYIVSLIKGENFSDIIVMTFTNKATSEIEERILKFLSDLSFENEEGKNLKESINKLYPELEITKEKINKIYKTLITNKDNLKIFTLDAFKGIIFKNVIAPMQGIFSYEIINDNENLEILKKVFEKISSNEEIFIKFEEFFSDRVERDVEKYILTLQEIIKYRWRYIFIKNSKKIIERKKISITDDEIIDTLDEIKERIITFYDYKQDGKPLEDFANKIFKKYLTLKNKEEKKDYFENNLSEIINSNNLHNGSKTLKKDETTFQYKIDMKDLKDKINNLLAKKIFNENVIPYEKQILTFVEILYNIYDEIKFREKKFTQDDIKDYLLIYMDNENLNLIKNNSITDYMREIIESDCSSVFIDEFQDTSIAQWKILEPFINSAKNIICVGDEKQSIYGWRDGEKNLFRDLSKIIKSEEENLDTSFRSEKNIINFTNDIFKDISQKLEINWDFIESKSVKKETEGSIRIYNFSNNEQEYATEIVRILNENFQNNYGEVGIIARTNKILNEIAEKLSENKIPYTLETNKNIFEHKGINSIIKLLKYFLTDNIFYLLEFLRSDLILLDDVFLKNFIDIYNSYKNIALEKVLETEGIFSFSQKEITKKVYDIYNKHYNNNFENSEIILDIIDEFGVTKIYDKENDIKNIYKFIDVSKNFNNIKEFLKEIEKNGNKDIYKQVVTQTENSVNLLSTHKAKGLEYNSVFYIIDEEKAKADTGLNFNIKLNDNYSEVEEYLVCDAKYEKSLSYLENIYNFYDDKELKKIEEELNILYVGLTRPKANLFIIIKHLKDKESFYKKIFKNYLNENLYQLGDIKFYSNEIQKIKKLEEKYLEIDLKQNKKSDEKLQENLEKLKNDSYKYSLELEEKRNIGNIIHYFLENIKYGEKNEIEVAKNKTFSKYGSLFERKKIENEILSDKKIDDFFKNNSEVFSKKWDIIYNEYSIYSEEENKLYRIDRLMIDTSKKEIFIVDYKTGDYEEQQIELYKKLVLQELDRVKEKENYSIKTKYIEI